MAQKDPLLEALSILKSKGGDKVMKDKKISKEVADIEKRVKGHDKDLVDVVKAFVRSLGAMKKANAADKDAVKAIQTVEKLVAQDPAKRTKLAKMKVTKPS